MTAETVPPDSNPTGVGRPAVRRSILANTTMNGIAQFASLFSTLVFFPLLVSAFGMAEYGVYVIAMTVTSIAVMCDLGIGASTVRLVARRVSLDDSEGFAHVVVTSTVLLSLLGVLAAAVIAGLALASASIFNVSAEQAGLLRTLLMIGAAMQLWFWPTSVATQVLQGLERYDLVARTSLATTLGSLVAIAIVLFTKAGPVLLMLLGAVIMVLASLINIAMLWRVRPAGRMAAIPRKSVAQEIVLGGIPIFAVGFTQFINREQTDRLVVAIILGPTAVAIYEVAAKLSMLITQVIGLPVSAILPVASRMAANDDDPGLRGLFLRGSRYITLAVLPIIVVLIVLAGPFIRAWFGPAFETSVVLARLLVLAQVFVPLYLIGDLVLMGKGRIALWVPPGMALALLNVILSVVFVRMFGLVGVAFGTVLAGFLELPVYAWLILPEIGVSVRQWLKTAGVGYLLVPVVAIPAFLLAMTPLGASMAGVAVCAAASVGAYWLSAYFFVLSTAERAQLGQRIRRSIPAPPGGAR